MENNRNTFTVNTNNPKYLVKTITVDGFNSEYFDSKINSFLSNEDINVVQISFSTALSYSNSTIQREKFVYTANIVYYLKV